MLRHEKFALTTVEKLLRDLVYPEYSITIVQKQDEFAFGLILCGYTDSGQRVSVSQVVAADRIVNTAGIEALAAYMQKLVEVGQEELAARILALDKRTAPK